LTTLTNAYNDLLWNIGFAICHQLPERSFFYGGMQMPVCARDMGTYIGFIVVLAYWLIGRRYMRAGRPDVYVLAVAAIGCSLYTLDAILSYTGLIETSNTIRLMTGLLMGSSLGLLLLMLLSIFSLEGDERTVFGWRDLIPIFAIVLAVGVILNSLDLGLVMFYIVEMMAILGLLALFFTLFTVLISFLTNRKLARSRDRRMILVLAAVLETVFLISSWFLHHALYLAYPPL